MTEPFSIITVNYNANDFLKLLVESIQKHSKERHQIVVIENSGGNWRMYHDTEVFIQGSNIGHGQGLNLGVQQAKNEFVLFLDVDCHLLTSGWEDLFLKYIKNHKVIVAPGVKEKPIRPACLFMRKEDAEAFDFSSTPGYRGVRGNIPGYDVAIRAFYQMVEKGFNFKFMDVFPGRYGPKRSEEYGLDGKPICFHYWHGSATQLTIENKYALDARKKDFPDIDLLKEKEDFFKEIYAP